MRWCLCGEARGIEGPILDTLNLDSVLTVKARSQTQPGIVGQATTIYCRGGQWSVQSGHAGCPFFLNNLECFEGLFMLPCASGEAGPVQVPMIALTGPINSD